MHFEEAVICNQENEHSVCCNVITLHDFHRNIPKRGSSYGIIRVCCICLFTFVEITFLEFLFIIDFCGGALRS